MTSRNSELRDNCDGMDNTAVTLSTATRDSRRERTCALNRDILRWNREREIGAAAQRVDKPLEAEQWKLSSGETEVGEW